MIDDLVFAVKMYARKHYEKDGWDIVVECYDDKELATIIGKARTVQGAIAKVKAHVGPQANYRAEIRSEIF